MKFALPAVSGCQMRVTARATRNSTWSTSIALDDSAREVEIPLPANVAADDVDVFVHYLTGAGEVDATRKAAVLKTSKRPKLPARSVKSVSSASIPGNVTG